MDYLTKYGYAPDQEAISRALEILAANLENVASEQVYKDCFSMMDLTTLKTDDTPASVQKLVASGFCVCVLEFCKDGEGSQDSRLQHNGSVGMLPFFTELYRSKAQGM